jgi:hypothetical protein
MPESLTIQHEFLPWGTHESQEDNIPYLIHMIRDTPYNGEFLNFDCCKIANALIDQSRERKVGL